MELVDLDVNDLYLRKCLLIVGAKNMEYRRTEFVWMNRNIKIFEGFLSRKTKN